MSSKPLKANQVQARQPRITVKVEKLALFRVGRDLVSFGNLFKSIFRHPIPEVFVRVIPWLTAGTRF